MAADPNKLKGYLKSEIQRALGITIDSAEFDRVMQGFANAIDTYLKQDISVAIGIESEGTVQLPPGVGAPPPGPNPTVATSNIILTVESTTTGKLE